MQAQTVVHVDRSAFEETGVGILWCPECGALGTARYTDGEWIRWALPRGK